MTATQLKRLTHRFALSMGVILMLNFLALLSSVRASPSLAGCPVFPADNLWNTSVEDLPVDTNSNVYIATIGADRGMHPDETIRWHVGSEANGSSATSSSRR